MHDLQLSARIVISSATADLCANARHSVTQTLNLAPLAELRGQRIELGWGAEWDWIYFERVRTGFMQTREL